jgi:hypothetical protein
VPLQLNAILKGTGCREQRQRTQDKVMVTEFSRLIVTVIERAACKTHSALTINAICLTALTHQLVFAFPCLPIINHPDFQREVRSL